MERLLFRFEVAAKAHHEAMEAMDEEKADHQARLLVRLSSAILERGEPGRRGLLALTLRQDPAVAGMAAVYAMHLDPGGCLAVLRRISSLPGLLGFRAKVAVERWEKGEWE